MNSVALALFDKILVVSFLSNKTYKSGELVNFLQTDCDRLYEISSIIS